jgi:hypothetical protein
MWGDAAIGFSSRVSPRVGEDDRGGDARVPGLIWVLEPDGFGDMMLDGVCPVAGVVAAARSFRDHRLEVGMTGDLREPTAGHRCHLGCDASAHRSGCLDPGVVAQLSEGVMDPPGQFASD